jgi:hypothetical protein
VWLPVRGATCRGRWTRGFGRLPRRRVRGGFTRGGFATGGASAAGTTGSASGGSRAGSTVASGGSGRVRLAHARGPTAIKIPAPATAASRATFAHRIRSSSPGWRFSGVRAINP